MSPQRPSRSRPLPAKLLALCGGLSAIPCAAQPVPTFTDVGLVPGAQLSYLRGVSSDGNVAVGNIQSGTSQTVGRWTRQTGLEDYGWPGYAFATSSNGSVMVGAAPGGRAFRLANGQYSELPAPPGGSDLAARSVSDDGAVVAGNLWIDSVPRAFRWTAATGLVPLPVQTGVAERFAYVYQSGNGEFIVGTASAGPLPSSTTAFRYTNGQYLQLLPAAGYQYSYAWGVDNSGYVVVGTSYNQTIGREVPVRWRLTPGGGGPAPELLGTFPGADYTFAMDVTDDGDVVVGQSNFADHETATMWNSSGPHDLNALLASMGVSTNGLYLVRATAISGDGSVIVGWSGSDGTQPQPARGWVIDFRRDTDGDGLLDSWEINGIPYINDLGQAKRLILPGANPTHKDLYVEVDSMAGVSMLPAAVDLVVAAFNNAPLDNPDGTTGVHLHVLMDETDLPYLPVWQTDGCWPLTFTQSYNANFGTAAQRQQNGGTGSLFRNAKAKAYRYTIVADRSQPSIGGCAGAPSDKSVVFFGAVQSNADSQAAIFMHEFGHMLGLEHGGGDQVNGKPNYPSIMNYVLCYPFPWSAEFWRLDYSRAGGLTLGHLNEGSLDENRGIGFAGGEYSDFIMPFGVSTPQGGRQIAYVSLDGAPVDYGNPAGTMVPDGNFDTSVSQDLNFLPSPPPGVNLPAAASPGQALQAHNDWAVVILPTPEAIGPGAPAPVYPTDELTTAARDWIEQNFPIPGGPAPCYANCDGSILPPVLNANDFNCFLNKYAANDPYANCDGSTAAPVLNANDFNCFLNKFAAGCT